MKILLTARRLFLAADAGHCDDRGMPAASAPHDWSLRAPTVEDVEALALLHTATWRETYSGRVPDRWLGEEAVELRRRHWRSRLEHPLAGQRAIVAHRGPALVGFAVSGPPQSPEDPPSARELFMIYLARSAHGSGAGQAMLDEVLGDEPAYLWVAKENPRAQRFYARNGFRHDGMEKSVPGIEGFVEIRLVR